MIDTSCIAALAPNILYKPILASPVVERPTTTGLKISKRFAENALAFTQFLSSLAELFCQAVNYSYVNPSETPSQSQNERLNVQKGQLFAKTMASPTDCQQIGVHPTVPPTNCQLTKKPQAVVRRTGGPQGDGNPPQSAQVTFARNPLNLLLTFDKLNICWSFKTSDLFHFSGRGRW